MPALGGNATFNFNNSINTKLWTQPNQGSIAQGNNGTAFTISKSGDSPTLKSTFYLFFGRVEIVMQAAPGQGIISSAILESDDLDEIDWEFMGSNSTYLFTNYYGKGNTTSNQGQPDARGIDYPAASSPQGGFHNYTTDWTKDRIQWWVDGKLLRELTYDNASVGTNGSNYPQTPMTIRLGSWAGGDTSKNAPGVVVRIVLHKYLGSPLMKNNRNGLAVRPTSAKVLSTCMYRVSMHRTTPLATSKSTPGQIWIPPAIGRRSKSSSTYRVSSSL